MKDLHIIIPLLVFVVSAVSWFVVDRRLIQLRVRTRWRIAWWGFCVIQLGLIALLAREHGQRTSTPTLLLVGTAIWHVVVAPLTAALGLLAIRWWSSKASSSVPSPGDDFSGMTRRRFFALAGVAAPAVMNVALCGVALHQLRSFRIRSHELVLSSLPASLDGYRVLHFSDTHIGRFTSGQFLLDAADTINSLRPDLVAFTGDLINDSLRDLPEAMRMLRRIEAPDGLYLCEGNHDLFDNGQIFHKTLAAHGFNILYNRSIKIRVRGVDLAIRGLGWYQGADGRHLESVLPDADFGIVLSHHPHAFDRPQLFAFPLVLAGHTHGGQLMLTPSLGPGPLMFRYWSGTYLQSSNRALVVSNGLGNWFPLRINAPAELNLITLRSAVAATGIPSDRAYTAGLS